MTNIDQIRELIAKNKLSKALQILQKYVKGQNPELHTDVIMLRSRLRSCEKELSRGLITKSITDQTKSQINEAVLDICIEIEEMDSQISELSDLTSNQSLNQNTKSKGLLKRFIEKFINLFF